MGFGNGGFTGGKKGPRQSNGSFKNKVALKPAHEKPFLDAVMEPSRTTTKKQTKKAKEKETREQQDEEEGSRLEVTENEEEEEELNDYRQGDEVKPLAGVRLSVTGFSDQKQRILREARSLGAEASTDMSTNTTHLIVEQPGSVKHKVGHVSYHYCRYHRYQYAWCGLGCDATWLQDYVYFLDRSGRRSLEEWSDPRERSSSSCALFDHTLRSVAKSTKSMRFDRSNFDIAYQYSTPFSYALLDSLEVRLFSSLILS